MKVVVGLGNPGSAYQNTRHNAGFAAVEALCHFLCQVSNQMPAESLRSKKGNWLSEFLKNLTGDATACGETKFQHKKNLFADIAKMEFNGEEIVLVKPTTYMNESGKAVQAILHWYKVKSANMIVVHDDVSLPLGKLRLQNNGGAGGQHGIESIIESLSGSKDFDRLKVGVGPDPGGDRRAAFVLAPISLSHKSLFDKVIDQSKIALITWLSEGVAVAANKFNGVTVSADEANEFFETSSD
jgi:PTH1 family peptidyl-tRNA hydrolase